jgi:hypothetical protein
LSDLLKTLSKKQSQQEKNRKKQKKKLLTRINNSSSVRLKNHSWQKGVGKYRKKPKKKVKKSKRK